MLLCKYKCQNVQNTTKNTVFKHKKRKQPTKYVDCIFFFNRQLHKLVVRTA